MVTLSTIAARCGAAIAVTVAACGIAHAGDGPRVVPLEVCIDGLDNLHVKDGRLSWEHLAYERPEVGRPLFKAPGGRLRDNEARPQKPMS